MNAHINIETADENLHDTLVIRVLTAKTPDDRLRALALFREAITPEIGDNLAAFMFESTAACVSAMQSTGKYKLPPKMRAAGFSEEEIAAAFLPVSEGENENV